jgi:putative transposase
MCHVHLMRAVLRNVAKKYHKEVADEIIEALEDETKMQDLILGLKDRS